MPEKRIENIRFTGGAKQGAMRLDGVAYVNCEFDNMKITVATDDFLLRSCKFDFATCEFEFTGAAAGNKERLMQYIKAEGSK